MTTRANDLRRALRLSALSVVWSGAVGSVATYAALIGGSLSLLGFGADAVIDAAASAALIWRFTAESRRPEHAHRLEQRAERLVGLALVVLAVYLGTASIRSLLVGARPETSALAVAILLASVLVLPLLAIAKHRLAARLGSGALRADSILTAAAALLAAISLGSLLAADALGLWWADAVAALAVGAILLREGWSSLALSQSAT